MSQPTKLFEEQDCPACGVRFGVPFGYTERRQADKVNFYCPNGHSMSYRESEADRLRRERDKLVQDAAYQADRLRDEKNLREQAERRVAAAKGQITKLKNRASKGVCPCRNRHFTDLERHMHSKHPSFVAEPDVSEHVH